jgi:PTH1 family peptidyl-tRNA hydrolase
LILNTNQYTRFDLESVTSLKGKQIDYVLGDWDDEKKLRLKDLK